MVRRVFVDTAWNSKPHVCYDPAEDRFFEVNDLAELIGKYDVVYIDVSIFPRMWSRLGALINNGAKVFFFAWPWKWKKMREKYANYLKKRFGKKKTDYGDAYILSKIYDDVPKAFTEVTPLDIEFKPLLMRERALAKELMRLRQMLELDIDVKDEIKDYEERLRKIRSEIVEKAMEKIPKFMEIVEKLRLKNDDINALSALVGLLIYLKWPYKVPSCHKARKFLGLYKPTRDDKRKYEERRKERFVKCYSHHARKYLSSLTVAILIKATKSVLRPRIKDEKEVLRMLLEVLKTINSTDAGGGVG